MMIDKEQIKYLITSFRFWVEKKFRQFGNTKISNNIQESEGFLSSFDNQGKEILVGFYPHNGFGGYIGKFHSEPIVKVFFDENKTWKSILEPDMIHKIEEILQQKLNQIFSSNLVTANFENLIKKAIGLHIVPLYDVPEMQEQKEFDCDFRDKTPIGDDEPIAPGYDNLYLGPLHRLKYSSIHQALDYSSLSPSVQHEYGTGYDGPNSQNRSEFPRFFPFQRHNYYTKITDGDYDESEYSEGNPSLLPKRDCEEKYRDTDYTNIDDNRTQHYRDHNMNQNTLELLGCIEKLNKKYSKA